MESSQRGSEMETVGILREGRT